MQLDFMRRTQRCGPCCHLRYREIPRLAACTVMVIYRFTLPGFSQQQAMACPKTITYFYNEIFSHFTTQIKALTTLALFPSHSTTLIIYKQRANITTQLNCFSVLENTHLQPTNMSHIFTILFNAIQLKPSPH